MSDASKLINDLSHVPNIIGGLGLSIAAAQKALNLDFLESMERILAMTRLMLGGIKAPAAAGGAPQAVSDTEQAKIDQMQAVLRAMITSAAPARYQFTETTLSVKLDLAQSMDVAGSASLGLGFGAVAVSAALSIGYSYDYRAAAECRTVLHAIPADANGTVFNALLDRAKEIGNSALTLPERSTVDQAILDKQASLSEKLTGIAPPAIAKPQTA
jgi:hypothetical protein